MSASEKLRALDGAGAKVWVCSDCGQHFAWTERSYWYGSWRDVDDGEWDKIDVYCGCRPCPEHLEGGDVTGDGSGHALPPLAEGFSAERSDQVEHLEGGE